MPGRSCGQIAPRLANFVPARCRIVPNHVVHVDVPGQEFGPAAIAKHAKTATINVYFIVSMRTPF